MLISDWSSDVCSSDLVGACLGEWGAPTVSGLAAGIDQLAHEHSLRAGVPTIAVLGTGMLEDYPKGAGRLRDHILGTVGTLVSEYRSEEHTSELQSLMRISYAGFCLKQKTSTTALENIIIHHTQD